MSRSIRALITAPQEAWGDVIQAFLQQHGVECDSRSLVSYDEIVDRGLLEHPDMIVVVLPEDAAGATPLIRELSQVCKITVMAIGPAKDPQRILSVLQSGATDYIDRDSWPVQLEGAILRCRTRSSQTREWKAGTLIGVVSASGGTGTSTVAANLALSLVQRHPRTLLMDLDLKKGDLMALLDLRPQFTLADLCEHAARLDRNLFEQILTPHPSRLQVLAAPYDGSHEAALHLRGVRRALAFARDTFSYSVVDLGSAEMSLQEEALVQMNSLALVFRLDYPSVRNARRFLDRLPRWGIAPERVRLVANRCGQWRQLPVSQAEAALGRTIDFQLPDDPTTMNRAINTGRPVVQGAPRTRIARRLNDFSIAMNGKPSHEHVIS